VEVRKLYSGCLLDNLHARVHLQGFRNRNARFWTELVPRDTEKYQEAGQK
jgi:hypothetical protein